MKKEKNKENKFNHEFKKVLGQNFISDKNLLLSLASDAGVTKEDVVIEIGAGAGTLTEVLAEKAKYVLSFEVDESLRERLEELNSNYGNLKIVFKDILKVTSEELVSLLKESFNYVGKVKVVANIPYYISSPIILKFLEEELTDSLLIMVQKEVAERVVSKPKTPSYGALSVLVQTLADVRLTRVVKRHNFYPVPNVDSALLKIVKKNLVLSKEETKKVSLVIQKCFLNRRKTLVNNLIMGLGLNRTDAEDVVTKLGFSLAVRPEELTGEDYITLSKLL